MYESIPKFLDRSKNVWIETCVDPNVFGSNYFWIQKILNPNSFLDAENHLDPKCFGSTNIWIQKNWIQKLSFDKNLKLRTKSTQCTTLELPESDTNKHLFIHSCWRPLDVSSWTPMHVNMLLVRD